LHLERLYRRLLAFYPKAFRREHEQEMLSVLMAGAAEGQGRPSLGEATDLVSNALFMRLWQTFTKLFVRPYEVRYRRLLWGFRVVWGLVLVGAAIVELSYGSLWALWLLAGAAADFVFGYLIYRIAQKLASDVSSQRV
jgi:hypothetical protein